MIVNANSIVQYIIQIKSGIIKNVNVNVKAIASIKKVIVGILPHVFVRTKYLKSIPNTSVTERVEIIIVMDNVSTKKSNTIATNVTSTASVNCQSKKVRNCYILHVVLLTVILLLIIITICFNYAKRKKLLLKILRVIISMI